MVLSTFASRSQHVPPLCKEGDKVDLYSLFQETIKLFYKVDGEETLNSLYIQLVILHKSSK